MLKVKLHICNKINILVKKLKESITNKKDLELH